MNITIKKLAVFGAVALIAMTLLTGCKPSEKKVKQSTYYTKLKKKYDKLKKENKELKSQIEENTKDNSEEERVTKFLTKISRDKLDKLEVGYYDNMEGSEFVEDENSFILATGIAIRAALTTKYTPDELAAIYSPVYEYVLYDENNAIYEMTIYEGDYVVMSDLPDEVFYCYNASALGKAFLHYKNGYPNSSLLHRLADSALITDEKGNAYENDIASKVANAIDRMEKTKSKKSKAEKYWKKHNEVNDEGSYEPESSNYMFYHHGNKMNVTLYDVYIRIENMDENATWYKVTKEDINTLKTYLSKENTANAILEKANTFGQAADSSSQDAEATTEHEHDIDED